MLLFGGRHLVNPRQKLISTIIRTAATKPSFNSTRTGNTVDADEVKRFAQNFDYDFWWKSKEGEPLRSMNELRVPLIRDSLAKRIHKPPSPSMATLSSPSPSMATPSPSILTEESLSNKPLKGLKVLEVGSGGGLLCEPMARLGASTTGIDPVPENIDISLRHLRESSPELTDRLSYVCSSIEDFAKVEKNVSSFDGLVASEVLEHVEDVDLFLESGHKLIKPGGRLIITTINQTFASQILAISIAENILKIVPKGTHSYKKLIPLNGLVLLLRQLGFTVESIHGMTFNPFTGKWSWSSSTAINFALVAVKL